MIRTLAATLAATCLVSISTPTAAQTRDYDVPAGSLRSALDVFARQSGRQVMYRGDQVRSARSSGARGTRSAENALEAIVAGSGFVVKTDRSGAFAVVKAGNGSPVVGEQATKIEPQSPAADLDQGIGEVVVTARRREERLQDVPLAITSFDAAALEASGVETLRDLSYLTPGVTINSGGSEYGVQPVIRGLTNLNGGSGDPNVAVFLDGVYLQNLSALNLSLIDVERIEVVKGPVSALYGRNAFAGAINYVSKQPGGSFGGRVTATLGNDGQRNLTGSINAPLIADVLSVRLAAGYDAFRGSYQDSVNGRRAGGWKKRDVQASIRFTPTSRLAISSALYYGDDFFDQSALAYNRGNCGPLSTNPLTLGQPTQYCGRLNPDAQPIEVPALPQGAGATGNQRKVLNANLHVDYDLEWSSLAVVFGYNKVTEQRYNDFLGLRNGITFNLSPGPGQVNLLELFGGDSNTRDNSQEIRLSSKQDQSFRWSIGGYHYKATAGGTTLIGLDGTPVPAGQTISIFPEYLTSNGKFSTTAFSLSEAKDEQYSAFVGADFDLFANLTASGEFRHTFQKKSLVIIRSSGVPATPANPNPVLPFGPGQQADFKFDNFRATLRYKIQPNVMAYVSGANGTKAGGFNQRAVIPEDIAYNPETNMTYEVGLKSTFLDNKLQLNVAAFHIKSKGLQISAPSASATNTSLVTKNFGGAISKGAEIELTAVPVRGVRINAGLGYADPKFNSGAFDFGSVAACNVIAACAARVVTYTAPSGPRPAVSLNGLQVPRSIKVQVTTGIQFNGNLGADWAWTARADYRYESRQYSLPNNFNYFGPRDIVNLRASVAKNDLKLVAFVDNLTNDHTPETASYNARLNDFNGYYTMYLPLGRRYGVTATYEF